MTFTEMVGTRKRGKRKEKDRKFIRKRTKNTEK